MKYYNKNLQPMVIDVPHTSIIMAEGFYINLMYC